MNALHDLPRYWISETPHVTRHTFCQRSQLTMRPRLASAFSERMMDTCLTGQASNRDRCSARFFLRSLTLRPESSSSKSKAKRPSAGGSSTSNHKRYMCWIRVDISFLPFENHAAASPSFLSKGVSSSTGLGPACLRTGFASSISG